MTILCHSVFAALIMSMTYGLEIQDEHNEHVIEATAWTRLFNEAIQPGRFWVDVMPLSKKTCNCLGIEYTNICNELVKHVPGWLPGAGFKTFAQEMKMHLANAIERPFNVAKRNFVILLIEDFLRSLH